MVENSSQQETERSAAEDVAAAFANKEAAKRRLVARAAGVDEATAEALGY